MAFSLLQDMYKPDAAAPSPAGPNPSIRNPFLPVLLSAFEQAGAAQQHQQEQHPALFAERLFVAELLINPQATREVGYVVLPRNALGLCMSCVCVSRRA